MRLRVPLVTFALILTIAACSKHDPVADDANNTGNLVAVVDRANATANAARGGGANPAPPEPSPALTSPTSPPSPQASRGQIPARLQGRWGLTPADCMSAAGNAKGLLVIGGGELRFYDSRAVPSPGAQTDDGTISGNFEFTGDGRTWSKFEALKLSGDKLTRTQTNPAASYTYAKC